ncbi:receptor-transporting protein 2 isoform X1 [Manacus candei]|uniref:receptor-transporting protein 2 isoform X1 n=1 Tax=Manacus candei TaxID=415023 RepID=UPI0022278C7D|nr:receptor-transporting protein 2 isoform X1 [Manacus candei]
MVTATSTAPGGTMMSWQDIFKEKLAEMHVTEQWTLQEDDTLKAKVLSPHWKEFVQRRALGRFQCSQCCHKWTSAKVLILFHMRQCPGWGITRMRVFRQECRRCPSPQLEYPEFSLETVERILHNLVVKILQYFYNKPVQSSDLLEVAVDIPVTGPHNSARCEACRLGICNKSRQAPALDTWKTWKALRDAWKALMDADKDRTHHTKSSPAPECVDRECLLDADGSLKHQGSGPHTASIHCPSPCSSNFPWKHCCCIGSSLLFVLAMIIFFVVYFTRM